MMWDKVHYIAFCTSSSTHSSSLGWVPWVWSHLKFTINWYQVPSQKRAGWPKKKLSLSKPAWSSSCAPWWYSAPHQSVSLQPCRTNIGHRDIFLLPNFEALDCPIEMQIYLSFSNVTKQKFLGSLFFDLSIGLITSETAPNCNHGNIKVWIAPGWVRWSYG